MKVWPWDRFAPQLHPRGSTGPAGWSAMGPVGSHLSLSDLATGLSVLEAARDRVGRSFELLLEGHSRWDVNMAIRILSRRRTDRCPLGRRRLPAGQRRGPGPIGARDARPSGRERTAYLTLRFPRGLASPGGPCHPRGPGVDWRDKRGAAYCGAGWHISLTFRPPRLHRPRYRASQPAFGHFSTQFSRGRGGPWLHRRVLPRGVGPTIVDRPWPAPGSWPPGPGGGFIG